MSAVEDLLCYTDILWELSLQLRLLVCSFYLNCVWHCMYLLYYIESFVALVVRLERFLCVHVMMFF
jgi:hypothetical protein